MKIDIRKKHLFKNLLIKQIFSSYIVTFLIIASFSLILLGTYEIVVSSKKLFTTSDENIEKETIKEEDKIEKETIKEEDKIEKETIKEEDKIEKETIKEEDKIEKETIKEEDKIEKETIKEEESDSKFWVWLSNYNEEKINESYNSFNKTKEIGLITKLKNKSFNDYYYLITNYLLLKFEKYFK